MKNPTKNQHYISQSEQRSNCIDEAVLKDNKRIYEFSIIDREDSAIRLTRGDGVKIKKNLSFSDLFSFEVEDGPLRRNLESFFHKYETDLDANSRALVAAVRANSETSVITDLAAVLLKAKLMGSIRNPFCIGRTLSFFESFDELAPTDPQLRAIFSSIGSGAKPHLERVCSMFEITPKQYSDWLSVIYLALVIPPGSRVSILESMVDGLIASPGKVCHMILASFDDVEGYRVALPDTGYLQGTKDPYHNMLMFNVNKNAYASFSFVDLSSQTIVPIPDALRYPVSEYRVPFSFQYHHNDFKLLRVFNVLAVYQSARHVFCADRIVYGVNNLSLD